MEQEELTEDGEAVEWGVREGWDCLRLITKD